jgi:3-hydroxyisobutyrate dehydrogenase
MIGGRFAPGFPLRHAVKDAELASEAAQLHGLRLPLTDALVSKWREAIARGHAGDDIASVVTAARQLPPSRVSA